FLVPFGSAALKGQAVILSGVCFFAGSCALIFSKPSKEKGLLWLSGFVVAVGASIITGVQALYVWAIAFPLQSILILGLPLTLLVIWALQKEATTDDVQPVPQDPLGISLSRLVIKRDVVIGAVELVEFPESHLQDKESNEQKNQPFYKILRVMMLANYPLALRYQRIKRRLRVFYLTWARNETKLEENLDTLEDTIKANLTGFKRKRHVRFQGPTISPLASIATSYLLGEPLSIEEPKQDKDAINVLAEVLLGMEDGIIQISAIPRRSSDRALKALEKQYQSETESSQLTVSTPQSTLFSGEVQKSTTSINERAVRNAESLQLRIARLSNSHLCEVEVAATCWDRDSDKAKKNSRMLIEILRGTLFPADPKQNQTIETKSKPNEAIRVVEGETIGKTTLLSFGEASVYFSIARNDLGVPIADHASFITNPADLRPNQNQESEDSPSMKSDILHLGQKLDDSGNPIGEFTIPLIDLASHSVFGGDTGTGKTVTQSNIALELNKLNVPFLAILASKHDDHLRLIRKVKGIRVFTPGDETTTPLRFSFSDFCEGMHVNSVINDTKAMFVATMPSQGIIKEYMEKVIELTCLRLGWDRETNTRGLPILFSDFSETLPLIRDEIQYSTRGNEDVWGALWGRYGTLYPSVLSSLFDTTSGMTIEELVSKPTILVLDRLSLEEQMFLVYWLVTRLARYFEAKKKTDAHDQRGLKYVVFMEEAQRFFSGGTGVKVDEDHGVRFAAVDAITTIMKESRSAGLGFCLIAPNLSKLTHNACNMALNIMMHRKGPKNDRKQIGDQMNCTNDQVRLIGSLPVGEAVVRTASISKPVRVRINNPVDQYPELAPGAPITDKVVKQFMKPVYEQYPEFKTKSGYSVEVKKDVQNPPVALVRIDITKMHRLYSIMDRPSIKGALRGMQEAAQSGNALIGALLLRNFVSIVKPDKSNLPFYCHHMLWFLSQVETPVSEENFAKITTELEQLVPLKKLEYVDFGHIHQRIRLTVERGLVSYKEDETALKADLKVAVNTALKEMKELQNKAAQSKYSENEYRLERLVQEIVKTEQFTTRHIERFNKALAGDLKPIVRMIKIFAKRIAGSEDDVCHVATKLLHHARSHLGSSDNDEVWKTIQDEVHSSINNSGSEVAV
ncbi:MAG: ATP-binding protein, partial [Candidatus Thorarchaeota archaeon]